MAMTTELPVAVPASGRFARFAQGLEQLADEVERCGIEVDLTRLVAHVEGNRHAIEIEPPGKQGIDRRFRKFDVEMGGSGHVRLGEGGAIAPMIPGIA